MHGEDRIGVEGRWECAARLAVTAKVAATHPDEATVSRLEGAAAGLVARVLSVAGGGARKAGGWTRTSGEGWVAAQHGNA